MAGIRAGHVLQRARLHGRLALLFGEIYGRQGARNHPTIAAFVAAGFEHSVANMYFIPYGLFVESTEAFPDVPDLTWSNFLWGNLDR